MKITIFGTGYVGLVTGACLSDFGFNITCCDIDKTKIENLKKGIIPIYEPGLKDLVERNVYYKRLSFTTDTKLAVEKSDVIVIAVGTPPAEDGSADIQHILQVAKNIGIYMNDYRVVVNKSTVPVGTGQKVRAIISGELQKRGLDLEFDVVSNPEFLREGSAISDSLRPDRVVLGAESEKAIQIMKEVYRVFYLNETPFVITNIETAEMIKYASNAFLATKITFINEVANLCEKVGANVQHVAKAMGMDGRIGPKFLHPGPGYGGSCFPKDTLALARIGNLFDSRLTVVEAVIEANQSQRQKMIEKIEKNMGSLKEKTIAILGLSFKPNTDDMREAPALEIIEGLESKGAKIKAFDPEAIGEAKWRLGHVKNVEFCNNEYEAMEGANAVVIITEWNQFRSLDLGKIKELLVEPFFFDLRNIYTREVVEKEGLKYDGVGI
ncbi:MAG: UDP-glucose dehydrogenase family protein [Thermincolia bacterium]